MMSLLRRWQIEEDDTYVLSLVRAILGVLLLLSGLRELSIHRGDTSFDDVFHIAIIPEALLPGPAVFSALLVAQIVFALLVVVGRWARPSLLATAVVGLYLLSCDRLGYHNNRYALLLFALLLAFSPCDRAFVWRRPAATAAERKGPLWAARLAQLQMSIIYLASGGSKLLDSDWREGRVIGDRLARATSLAVAKGVPAELMEVLAHPTLASALAKLAIVTELFLAVGLFLPRTRTFALWWGVMFHLTIEVTSQVELFTWLSLAVYALFAVPTLRERQVLYDPGRSWGGFLARVVERLDWLARFDIRADAEAARGHGFVIVERDGTRASGLLGLARVARATPLLFPLFVPLRVLARAFSPPEGG
ncbi:MAG TPA: HTTM domain-containing protein [Polyangiaceae bacterium]|nr:HTTM domain-containing protein [Polyangiaceae bacterium]